MEPDTLEQHFAKGGHFYESRMGNFLTAVNAYGADEHEGQAIAVKRFLRDADGLKMHEEDAVMVNRFFAELPSDVFSYFLKGEEELQNIATRLQARAEALAPKPFGVEQVLSTDFVKSIAPHLSEDEITDFLPTYAEQIKNAMAKAGREALLDCLDLAMHAGEVSDYSASEFVEVE